MLPRISGPLKHFPKLSAFIRTLLDDVDASTAASTLGLAIGTDVQKFPDFVFLQDQATSGTGGPAYTAAGWRTVTIDTEVADSSNICTLSSNQFTLAAGSYRINAEVEVGNPASGINRLRLYNITDTAVVFQGPNTGAASTIGETIPMLGVFTIADTKTFEIQIYPTAAISAGGAMGTGEVEVYASVLIQRYST